MIERLLAGSILLATPALADIGLFHEIRKGDKIILIRSTGECDAKVVGRVLDQLTLRPSKTTAVCGGRAVKFTLSRDDVDDVVDNRRRGQSAGRQTLPAICASLAVALVGTTGGFALGSTGHGAAAMAIVIGSAVGGAILCRDRSARYTIFAD